MSGVSKDLPPNVLGNIAETAVQSELIRRGYAVLTPWGNGERYDLVVDDDGVFHRLQVKTGTVNSDRETLRFRTCSSSTSVASGHSRSHYTPDDIDFFVVYCAELNSFYCVPIEDAPNFCMTLRLTEPGSVGPENASKVNWAVEHTLDRYF